MRYNKFFGAVGFVVVLLAVVGCKTVNTVELDKRIVTDATLNRAVSIVDVAQQILPDGLLKVQVDVLNRSTGVKEFNYKFEWRDKNGFVIKTPTSIYIPKQIEGKGRMALQGIAPERRATDFRVYFIERVR